MRGRIYVNQEKCLTCKRCKIACAVSHSKSGNLIEAMQEDPPPTPRMRLTIAGKKAVPVACKHCDGAPCIIVCPTGALCRNSMGDPVVLDQDLCVGCRSCVVVCPYGVPEMDKARTSVLKCDLCIDRLEDGREPACVEACLTGALEFVEEDSGENDTYVSPWNKPIAFPDRKES